MTIVFSPDASAISLFRRKQAAHARLAGEERRLAQVELRRARRDLVQSYSDHCLRRRFKSTDTETERLIWLCRTFRTTTSRISHFIALMLVSLIERGMRMEMQEQHIERLPLRPAGMPTKKPTWRTIMESFHGVHLATIERFG